MCGIVGQVCNDTDEDKIREQVALACASLHHRGPDDSGLYVKGFIGLGVQRLAIRDPENGRQPLTAEDGTTIVFNGELYGTNLLRIELQRLGYNFRTSSDTEILLHGYRAFGLEVLKKITGMFAFAIWDATRDSLILARDYFGEKPLYIASTPLGLAFASEPKGLKPFQGIDWDIAFEDVEVFLNYGYMPIDRTGWRGVRKLPPGHLLIWKSGNTQSYPYYQSLMGEINKIYIPNIQIEAKNLRTLLEETVRSCMESDKPIGAFLSGGLDSSSILALMLQQGIEVPVFSVGWVESDYDESSYAREVAEAFGCKHEIVFCSHKYVRDNFDTVLSFFDEPLADSSVFPLRLLSEIAKSQVDVVLTGDGGDEMFGGYKRYYYDVTFEKYDNICRTIPQDVRQRILARDKKQANTNNSLLDYYRSLSPNIDTVSMRRWIDIHTFLPCEILPKLDRTTMSVGLESRAPFLHPNIAVWALQCDPRIISQGDSGKQVLRAAVADLVPNIVLNREKRGFRAPIKLWFQTELYEWAQERLLSGSLGSTNWFDQVGLEVLLLEHKQGTRNHSRAILTLLVLEWWVRVSSKRFGTL